MGHTVSKCISKCIKPCSILVGKIPSCCYNKISDTDKYNLSLLIDDLGKPGDFILSRIDKRSINLFFGGAPYTHLGIITDRNYVIDMVAKGARKTSVYDWLEGKDRILVVRASTLTKEQTNQIVEFAEEIYVKETPYDFFFFSLVMQYIVRKFRILDSDLLIVIARLI